TGTSLLLVEPSPSSPELLSPQHRTSTGFSSNAQNESPTPDTSIAREPRPMTWTGMFESEVAPLPSSPRLPRPQQKTSPVATRAQAVATVPASWIAVPLSETWTGTLLLDPNG